MNALLKKIYETGEVEDAEGSKIQAMPAGVRPESAEALYHLATQNKMARTLEVGLAYGLSALCLCQAHRDNGGGEHVAMDPIESSHWKSIGLLNIKRAGLEEHFRFYEAPSWGILPMLMKEGDRFQLSFIDGQHIFDYALLDFFYSDLLVDVGGYVVLDDIWMPAIQRLVAFVERNRLYERLDSGKADNLAILKKLDDDRRAWDYHIDF